MAKNTEPIFTKSPLIGQAAIVVANPNLDGTGTIVEVVNGQTEGVRIDQIEVKAEVTTTSGVVRLFLSFDSGVTWFLWREISVAPIIPSAVLPSFRGVIDLTTTLDDPPLNLQDATVRLGASTERAEAFNVFARGGDFAA
jgi:hypothetical protein